MEDEAVGAAELAHPWIQPAAVERHRQLAEGPHDHRELLEPVQVDRRQPNLIREEVVRQLLILLVVLVPEERPEVPAVRG